MEVPMKRNLTIAAIAATGCLSLALLAGAGGQDNNVLNYLRGWPNYGQNSQHTALSPVAAQPLNQIHWQTPVDLFPQYQSNLLLIHYGSPLITARNNVLITVKTGTTGGFRVDSRKGSNGALNYSVTTDYVLPSTSAWTPSCGPTLTPTNALVVPAIGGTVLVRNGADLLSGSTSRQAFFGIANYNAAPGTYNTAIKINTPITSDNQGNLYFGFLASTNPLNLVSGLARLAPNGTGIWISATSATADAAVGKCAMNCAPALSPDGSVVYVGMRGNTSSTGYLVGLNSTTLAPLYKIKVKDPKSGSFASLNDSGTSSPTVAPDGEVYFGVLENPGGSNHSRGWMLHFNSTLTTTLTPGAFGWDDTASVFDSTAVPQYIGSSPYLLLTKYNNYAGAGDGLNKVAVLDPHASMTDPISGIQVMKEILLKVGPTPDPPNQGPGSPNAVREWCINTAAVDTVTKCAIVNNEDGKCYRWDFATNTLIQPVTLTAGIGEAYTPTLIGPDGQSYAINDAKLFALGQ